MDGSERRGHARTWLQISVTKRKRLPVDAQSSSGVRFLSSSLLLRLPGSGGNALSDDK